MTTLVEDLLLLARLDSGRPMRREPVDLTRLLVEAVSDARVLAPGHHWRIVVPDEPIEVTGDEQGLHQVVTNLLTNARKHTPRRHDGHRDRRRAARRASTSTTTDRASRPGSCDHAFERFARGDAEPPPGRRRRARAGAGAGDRPLPRRHGRG